MSRDVATTYTRFKCSEKIVSFFNYDLKSILEDLKIIFKFKFKFKFSILLFCKCYVTIKAAIVMRCPRSFNESVRVVVE